VKVKFGSFELPPVKINFAYEGENIWINVANMSDFIAGGANMGVSAGFLVEDAAKRYPQLTQKQAVKLPIIQASGEPSEEYQWYYRMDLDLKVFGLHPSKILMVETEIHKPLTDGLQGELES
jgi:hypothetical protein